MSGYNEFAESLIEKAFSSMDLEGLVVDEHALKEIHAQFMNALRPVVYPLVALDQNFLARLQKALSP